MVDSKKYPQLHQILSKAKTLYYYCPDDNESWQEPFEEEYGECDSECPKCGKDYTPFDSKAEWEKAKAKGKKK
jgi:hypothetical protein